MKSLETCREVSNFWKSMIDQQKRFWILFIQKLFIIPPTGWYNPNDKVSASTVPKNVEDFLRKTNKGNLITHGKNH